MKTFKFKIYPLEKPIIIRRAKKSDKLMQIAANIFHSHPKYFNYFFENREVRGFETIADIILTKNSTLNFNNIWVAAQGSKVWGALVALTDKTNTSWDYGYLKRRNKTYKHAIENGLEALNNKLKPDTVFIPYIFVHEAYRNFTVGRKLIISCEDYFLHKGFKYSEVYCLKENELLKNLLKNMNFKKVQTYKDFCTNNEKANVEIYRREIKKEEYYV